MITKINTFSSLSFFKNRIHKRSERDVMNLSRVTMTIIDLAGSESMGSINDKDVANEASEINLDLTYLQTMFRSMARKPQTVTTV